MFVVRYHGDYVRALELCASGLADAEVSRRTGIPTRTINGWRRAAEAGVERRVRPRYDATWRPPSSAAYVYLLGLYLGDGHIAEAETYPFMRISLDGLYPGIITAAQEALATTFAPAVPRILNYRPDRCVIVQLCAAALPYAFPQHGPGRKHQRQITLADWQTDLTEAHPRELLRGLIHSDGCRCFNTFQTRLPSGRMARYTYPRYFFSNLSHDIRSIFCNHCDLLGMRWTQSNLRNISVARRDSVARLDEFVGPKR